MDWSMKHKTSRKENEMKKLLTIILLLGVVSMAFTANTAYFVVEKDMGYTNHNPFYVNEGEEKVVAEITFTLPSNGHILLFSMIDAQYQATGSNPSSGYRIELDEDSIRPESRAIFLSAGEHTIQWVWWCNADCRKILTYYWCQVMAFYIEENSVSEKPPYVEPIQTSAIVTSAPAVYIPECSEIKDITGRTIDCGIEDGWVSLNTLSAGTYFAKGSTGRTTKIVKTY
jgi:hypothetical protein